MGDFSKIQGSYYRYFMCLHGHEQIRQISRPHGCQSSSTCSLTVSMLLQADEGHDGAREGA
jgi:hypothetical protein